MECEIASVNSNSDVIRDIFEDTKTIAIMGLSPDPSKASNRVAAYLQGQGFQIIPVYPKEDEILGEKVYRSLSEIPFSVDMVDVFRKPKALLLIAEECIKRGDVKCFWGQEGIVNNEAAALAQNAGIKVVQNKCTMVEHANL
ncbi:MAG TPA: CoA-binding protein [Sulfurimonas sp.]|nr:CoA-binding protein [Sulfurimonas sp.]